jgi:hypothetical protein
MLAMSIAGDDCGCGHDDTTKVARPYFLASHRWLPAIIELTLTAGKADFCSC